MILTALILFCFLMGAVGAHYYQINCIRNAMVSSLVETDYVTSRTAKISLIASFVIGSVLIMCAGITTAPIWVSVSILFLYLLVCFSLMVQTSIAAKSTEMIRQALAKERPAISSAKFVFYFSAPDLLTPDHVKVWKDEFDKLGIPWFVIVRERHHIEAFRRQGMPAALYIPANGSLKNALSKGVKTVFYANNGQKNRLMIAGNPQVQHVQLLHGDSDKPPSYSPLTKNYDLIFVAGQMAIDRYANHGVSIPLERFRIVGRPQVSAIVPARELLPDARRKIIYMPTWRGFNDDTQFSSLDRAAKLIREVLGSNRPLKLHFKPHPMSYKDPDWPGFKREIKKALEGKYNHGNHGVFCAEDTQAFDLYNQADLLISDISSVMIDFLYSGKPFLVVEPTIFDSGEINMFPSLLASYQVDGGLANLSEMLEDAVTSDNLASKRNEMRQHAFGDYGRPPAKAFQETCYALIG